MDLKNLNSFFKAVTPRREPKRTQRALLLENLRSIQVEIDNQGGTLTGLHAEIAVALRDGLTGKTVLSDAQLDKIKETLDTLSLESGLQGARAGQAYAQQLLMQYVDQTNRLEELLAKRAAPKQPAIDCDANGDVAVRDPGDGVIKRFMTEEELDREKQEFAEEFARERLAKMEAELQKQHAEENEKHSKEAAELAKTIDDLRKEIAELKDAPAAGDDKMKEALSKLEHTERQRQKLFKRIEEVRAEQAEEKAQLALKRNELAYLKHENPDPRAEYRDGVIARAGLMAAQTERAADFDEEQQGWRRRKSLPKEGVEGVEEEKGDEPAPPSPPLRALQDHNDNEETKDEAKAKVKKTPAKKGYVSARVKKIEGKE